VGGTREPVHVRKHNRLKQKRIAPGWRQGFDPRRLPSGVCAGRTADACQEDLGLAKQPLKQVVPQRAAAVGNLGVRAGRSHQTP
jgi:hypothetical protein